MRSILSILFSAILVAAVSGQSDTTKPVYDTLPGNYYMLHTVERNGVSLPEVNIREVKITGRRDEATKFPYNRYQRLIYNLKKVHPYALMVRSKLGEANEALKKIPEDRDRRKFLRQFEKDLFGEYEDDVRDMTITQGRLLIKLIDRETYNTSYELIRDYRGSFSAFFWQSIARIFGTNLKDEYDPSGQDLIIEIIVQDIEAGKL